MLGHGWHPRDFHVPLIVPVFWVCSAAVGQSWAFEYTHKTGRCADPQVRLLCNPCYEEDMKEGEELQHILSITWHWVFGINDGKDPIMPEHSVSQDAAVALRSTRLVLVNVPMLQLVRVRNECHSDRGAVPGFLIHFSVYPYLSSYTFYSAFSLPQRGRIRQDAINEEKPGNPVQSRKAQQSWQKDSTSLQNM